MSKRYVVKGTRTVNGESKDVWLAYHKDSGGAYQWDGADWKVGAHPFATKQAAIQAAKADIGPWFNQPSKDSLLIMEADYTPPQPAHFVIHEATAERIT